MRKPLIFFAMAAIGVSASAQPDGARLAPGPIQYPSAPTDPTVIDNYYGIKLADPFRPLENDRSPQTEEWVKAENAITRQYIDAIPYRNELRDRLAELYNYSREGLPTKENDGKYYISAQKGGQNQAVIYRSSIPTGKREVFLDPNTLSKDGTVALTGLMQSPSGKHTAYTISRNGSDWTEIYVMDTKSKKLLKDHIEWAKFTGAAWNGDDGFFYSAYDRPTPGHEFSSANEGHRVWYHKLGTPQSEDVVAFEDKANPLHFHAAYVPEKEPLLFVVKSGEGVGNALLMKRLDTPDAKWVVIEPTQDHTHSIVDVADGKIYIVTDENAPKRRLMVADVNNPRKENWKELVGESKGVLSNVGFAGKDRLLLTYEEDAAQHVDIANAADGKVTGRLDLPGYGSVKLSSGRKTGPEVIYSFTSFTSPQSIYLTNLDNGKTTRLFQPEIKGINLDDYVTEQVFYNSKDGTRVPMFITYKKGTERNGANPVYLTGYGGFNVSLTPGFSVPYMLWLENGGIIAQPNLRGGSEYGEEWHKAGTKMQKLNVFNDFIAAAEYLIDNKWTNSEKLAICGGSNGGLLVGAVTNMRPELFKVAIPRVGVMDMMRYHLFTIGWNWASDYGRSDDNPDMAKYLLCYSPMHNIQGHNVEYPAILVTTADHDDRVVPAHSFKYAATLQEAMTGNAPKLIRIDSNAGHGSGKPVGKSIEEWADIWAFTFNNMGLTPGK